MLRLYRHSDNSVPSKSGLPDFDAALKFAVSPSQLRGTEINDYAAQLARISIWIGFLKWKRENGL